MPKYSVLEVQDRDISRQKCKIEILNKNDIYTKNDKFQKILLWFRIMATNIWQENYRLVS